jgi:hypothetical protein
MAFTGVRQILNTPYSVWQADMDTLVTNVAQTLVLTEPDGAVHKFAPNEVFLWSFYLITPTDGQGARSVLAPYIWGVNGSTGTIVITPYADSAGGLVCAVMRLLFMVPGQGYGFAP